jgi:2-dehydropantoate 2-reductase
MRIGVIGAGAVGGTLAALLDRAGQTVEVTARGAHLAAIRAEGLRLNGGWGEHTARVHAGETLGREPEFVILATKAQDARAALEANKLAIRSVPVLVVQNGLGGLRIAREVLPSAPLLGGLALMAVSYLEPGVVTVTTPQPLIIGAGPDTNAGMLERVAEVLRPAIPIEVTDDIVGAQWTKLLINHINALPAITGLSAQEVIADAGLRRLMTASMRETVQLARQLGVSFGKVQGVSGRVLGVLGAVPLSVGETFPRLLARRLGEVPNPGSTLQSIRRGQLTEIDYLNGAVVAEAEAHGLEAPINAKLVELVHEVERTHAFLSPAEVVERIPV